MKSKIVALESKNKLDFPKLMIDSGSSVIVLFHTKGRGQVLSGSFTLGYYSKHWNIDDFKDFNGTINLSNE